MATPASSSKGKWKFKRATGPPSGVTSGATTPSSTGFGGGTGASTPAAGGSRILSLGAGEGAGIRGGAGSNSNSSRPTISVAMQSTGGRSGGRMEDITAWESPSSSTHSPGPPPTPAWFQPREVEIVVHSVKEFGGDDLVVNADVFPGLVVGHILMLSPVAAQDRPLVRAISSVRSVGGSWALSLSQTLADVAGLRTRTRVRVEAPDRHDVNLATVQASFKDQFVSRSGLWRFRLALVGKCIQEGEYLSYAGMRAHVTFAKDHNNRAVSSGLVTQETKWVFRSRSAKIMVLLHLSAEMWQYAEDGNLYHERAVDRFLKTLFSKWTALDLYHAVIDKCTPSDWASLLPTVKKEVLAFPSRAQWGPLPAGGIAYPTPASQGCFLEAINVCLNECEQHFRDRDLARMGQQLVVVSAGSGVQWTDPRLAELTRLRLMDNGTGCDLVCLTEPPLHTVPLFLHPTTDGYEDHSPSALLADPERRSFTFAAPHWLFTSFFGPDARTMAVRPPYDTTGQFDDFSDLFGFRPSEGAVPEAQRFLPAPPWQVISPASTRENPMPAALALSLGSTSSGSFALPMSLAANSTTSLDMVSSPAPIMSRIGTAASLPRVVEASDSMVFRGSTKPRPNASSTTLASVPSSGSGTTAMDAQSHMAGSGTFISPEASDAAMPGGVNEISSSSIGLSADRRNESYVFGEMPGAHALRLEAGLRSDHAHFDLEVFAKVVPPAQSASTTVTLVRQIPLPRPHPLMRIGSRRGKVGRKPPTPPPRGQMSTKVSFATAEDAIVRQPAPPGTLRRQQSDDRRPAAAGTRPRGASMGAATPTDDAQVQALTHAVSGETPLSYMDTPALSEWDEPEPTPSGLHSATDNLGGMSDVDVERTLLQQTTPGSVIAKKLEESWLNPFQASHRRARNSWFRWAHLSGEQRVAVDMSGRMQPAHWRSVCEPAVLPLTSDVETLSTGYKEIAYVMLLPQASDVATMGLRSRYDVVRELVCQRLAQDFQLLQEPTADQIGPGSKFRLSIGHQIHTLEVQEREVAVKQLIRSEADEVKFGEHAPAERPATNMLRGTDIVARAQASYPYCLWCPYTGQYQARSALFAGTQHGRFRWNYLDTVICGQGTGDVTYQDVLPYKSLTFLIVGLQSWWGLDDGDFDVAPPGATRPAGDHAVSRFASSASMADSLSRNSSMRPTDSSREFPRVDSMRSDATGGRSTDLRMDLLRAEAGRSVPGSASSSFHLVTPPEGLGRTDSTRGGAMDSPRMDAGPPSLAGMRWESVREEDLQCPLEALSSPELQSEAIQARHKAITKVLDFFISKADVPPTPPVSIDATAHMQMRDPPHLSMRIPLGAGNGLGEWLLLEYSGELNPLHAFSVCIKFLAASGKTVEEFIASLQKRVKQAGLQLIQVPQYTRDDSLPMPEAAVLHAPAQTTWDFTGAIAATQQPPTLSDTAKLPWTARPSCARSLGLLMQCYLTAQFGFVADMGSVGLREGRRGRRMVDPTAVQQSLLNPLCIRLGDSSAGWFAQYVHPPTGAAIRFCEGGSLFLPNTLRSALAPPQIALFGRVASKFSVIALCVELVDELMGEFLAMLPEPQPEPAAPPPQHDAQPPVDDHDGKTAE